MKNNGIRSVELQYELFLAIRERVSRYFTSEFKNSKAGESFLRDDDFILQMLSQLKNGQMPKENAKTLSELQMILERMAGLTFTDENEERSMFFFQIKATTRWILIWLRVEKPQQQDELLRIANERISKMSILEKLSKPYLRNEIIEEIEALSWSESSYWDKEPDSEILGEKSIQDVLIRENRLNVSTIEYVDVFLVDEEEARNVKETCSLFANIIQNHPNLSNYSLTKLPEWDTLYKSANKTIRLLRKNTPFMRDYLYDLKYPVGSFKTDRMDPK